MRDAFEIQELLREREAGEKPWLPFLDTPSLLAGIYVVGADDRETHRPHAMDEVYYAVRGRGSLCVEGEDRPVSPGSILYVAANREHYFHSIEEELTLLVFFAKGEGGG